MLLYVRTGSGGTGPAQVVEDLGLVIETSATWTLLSASSPAEAIGNSGNFTARDIRDSQDLFDLVAAGDLEWSKDGVDVELAADYRADYMITRDFTDDDFDFQNLSVSGQLTLSGINVNSRLDDLVDHLNGSGIKHDASEIQVEGTYSNIPVTPADLETTISGINQALTSSINSFSTITGDTGSATADSSGDSLAIAGVNGVVTSVTDDPEVVTIDGDALLPRDGSRPMTGTLDLDGNSIVSVLNATFTGVVDLSGATGFTLPQATNIAATFTSGAEGQLAWDSDDEVLYAHDGTQWFALAPASGIISDHAMLTGLGLDDHTQYLLLSGVRTRNELTGVIDATDGDILLPVETTGQTTLADGSAVAAGAVAVIDGQLATYDATRTKWLSANRYVYSSAKRGNSNNIYLRAPDGLAHSTAGIRIGENSTITGITVENSENNTFTVEIHRGDPLSPTVLATLAVSAALGTSNMTLNIDVDANDVLMVYINGNSRSPHVQFHLATRYN